MSAIVNYEKNAQVNCNVVLIGKTGTGKSTFANYLFKDDKFGTSIGRRGTGWAENFQQYAVDFNGVKINVYDSVGLEVNIISEWKEKFKNFLNKKCNRKYSGSALPADELMHIIFYVINAASGRAEDLPEFKDLLLDYDVPVTIILTNCDTATRDKIEGIKSVCYSNGFVDIIEVCSVKKQTRRGGVEPFGREEALHRIIDASAIKVGKELTLAVLEGATDKLYEVKNKLIRGIDESDISIFNLDSLDDFDVDGVLSDFDNINVDDLVPDYYKNYIHFMESIDANFETTEVFDNLMSRIDNVLERFDVEKISVFEEMQDKINALEDDDVSIFGKAWALLSVGYKVLTIKSTIKEGIEEMFAKLKQDFVQVKDDFEKERIWEQIKQRQVNTIK